MKHILYFLFALAGQLLTYSGISQPFPDQNKWYYIRSVENNEFMMAVSPATGQHTLPHIKTAALSGASDPFLWKFIKTGTGVNTFMIVNKSGDQYLDIFDAGSGYSKKVGVKLLCGRLTGRESQQFHLVRGTDNSYYLSSVFSGFVVTNTRENEYRSGGAAVVVNDSQPGGLIIRQSGLTGEKNQLWKLMEPFSSGSTGTEPIKVIESPKTPTQSSQ